MAAPPINHNIRSPKVRLIDADGTVVGVVELSEALKTAKNAVLDLVEVDASADPPACKMMDYGKHCYEEKKQKAAAKKRQVQTQVKEIKFRPGTEEGDYQVKLRNLQRFLEEGNKAKVSVRYRGREMVHKELGMKLLNRVERDLEELCIVEHPPKMDPPGSRVMSMMIAPKKRK